MDVDVKQSVMSKLSEFSLDKIEVKRIIYYFFDYDTKNAIMYKDTNLINEWTNPDTNELFTLNDVAMYHDGIPVYILIKGFNMSVGFDLEARKSVDSKGNKVRFMDLVIKGYNAGDMEAVLTSQTTNRLFKTIKKLDTSIWIAIVLSWVVCILGTSFIATIIVNAIYGA